MTNNRLTCGQSDAYRYMREVRNVPSQSLADSIYDYFIYDGNGMWVIKDSADEPLLREFLGSDNELPEFLRLNNESSENSLKPMRTFFEEKPIHISAHGLADLWMTNKKLEIYHVDYDNGYGNNKVTFRDVDSGKLYIITVA